MESGSMNLGGPVSWLEIRALSLKSSIRDEEKPRQLKTLAALPRNLKLVPSSLIGQLWGIWHPLWPPLVSHTCGMYKAQTNTHKHKERKGNLQKLRFLISFSGQLQDGFHIVSWSHRDGNHLTLFCGHWMR